MFMEVIFTKASARIYQVESVELRAALTNTNTNDRYYRISYYVYCYAHLPHIKLNLYHSIKLIKSRHHFDFTVLYFRQYSYVW